MVGEDTHIAGLGGDVDLDTGATETNTSVSPTWERGSFVIDGNVHIRGLEDVLERYQSATSPAIQWQLIHEQTW